MPRHFRLLRLVGRTAGVAVLLSMASACGGPASGLVAELDQLRETPGELLPATEVVLKYVQIGFSKHAAEKVLVREGFYKYLETTEKAPEDTRIIRSESYAVFEVKRNNWIFIADVYQVVVGYTAGSVDIVKASVRRTSI